MSAIVLSLIQLHRRMCSTVVKNQIPSLLTGSTEPISYMSFPFSEIKIRNTRIGTYFKSTSILVLFPISAVCLEPKPSRTMRTNQCKLGIFLFFRPYLPTSVWSLCFRYVQSGDQCADFQDAPEYAFLILSLISESAISNSFKSTKIGFSRS